MKLTGNARKWLKVFHVFLAGIWGGGAASLFALHCLFVPRSGTELYLRNLVLLSVDDYVVIPAAVGCLLTGLLYAQFTFWGYLKHYWLVVKLVANLLFLLAGFLWLVPWLHGITTAAMALRDSPLIAPGYDIRQYAHMAMAAGQAVLVFTMTIVSVFKPWGRTGIGW